MHEFTHDMFGTLRSVEINGEPWFLLTDVAKALGYQRTEKARKHLRDSQLSTPDRGTTRELGILGSSPTIITESGLYRLIMKSDASNAGVFQDWVTDDVLPALRRNGRYDVQENDAPAWFREFATKVDAIVPLAKAHNEVQETSLGYSLAETARRMGLGHHRLCAILRAEGVLSTPANIPTKFGVSLGYVVRRDNTAAVPESGYEGLRVLVTRHLASR